MKIELFRKLENAMIAVTFAERGDHDYAMKFLQAQKNIKQGTTIKKKLDNRVENRTQMRL